MTLADVLVVGPHKINVEQIELDYRELNRLVHGSIGSCPLPPGLREQGYYAYCDDDAIYNEQPLNRWRAHLGRWVLRGPIVIFRATPWGDEQGLEVEDVRSLVKYLAGAPSDEAAALAERDREFWADHPSGVHIVSIKTIDELFGE